MSDYLAILGRQPELSIAELECVYGSACVQPFSPSSCRFHSTTVPDVQRLGGSLKLGRVLFTLRAGSWRNVSTKIIQHYGRELAASDTKITLGLSVYDWSISPRDIQATGLALKKKLRASNVSLRLIPNSDAVLSTATSHHNKLGLSANKRELLIVRDQRGTVLIAESTGTQNITALAARDQGRPRRDAFVGMLPPKLALIMINLSGIASENTSPSAVEPLATSFSETSAAPTDADAYSTDVGREAVSENDGGEEAILTKGGSTVATPAAQATEPLSQETKSETQPETFLPGAKNVSARSGLLGKTVAEDEQDRQNEPKTILDPFCGTGVVLQEAALLGLNVYGTDLSQKMIDFSGVNLNWLKEKYRLDTHVTLAAGDAMNTAWQPPIDAVVCETYLGQPFSAPPAPAKLEAVQRNCQHIIESFLANLAPQIQPGTPLCIAVPAWRNAQGNFARLPLSRSLERHGYQRRQLYRIADQPLLYFRDDQVVARELYLLVKK